jgi:hypothetical protein
MGTPAAVRRIAPAPDAPTAAARLYQAMYGCTMHSAGLLHAIAAIFEAEAAGTYTLGQVAAQVAETADTAAAHAAPSDEWRYRAISALCLRLASSR